MPFKSKDTFRAIDDPIFPEIQFNEVSSFQLIIHIESDDYCDVRIPHRSVGFTGDEDYGSEWYCKGDYNSSFLNICNYDVIVDKSFNNRNI